MRSGICHLVLLLHCEVHIFIIYVILKGPKGKFAGRWAAQWVCGSRWNPISRNWSKSSDSCLQELHLSPLHTRRAYFSLSLAHDILHKRVAIPFSLYFQFSTTTTRSHPMTLCVPSSTINPCRYSFFVSTPFLWSSIPLRILQLPDVAAFRSALRHFLFVWSLQIVLLIVIQLLVIVICFLLCCNLLVFVVQCN